MACSEDTIEMPALGRPFQLGMLYDCRKEALIPGITLWDEDVLQKDLNIQPLPNTELEIIASDSFEDKASALNISPSLKASVLAGLVEVRGSARYLQDTKMSKHQARVTLHCKTTSRYEQLVMSHLGSQNIFLPAVFEHGMATHVVTAILYGGQAFFVFDQEVSSAESVQKVEGNLKAIFEKTVSIHGEAEIQMDEREKSQTEPFSCKFHGDFSLETDPLSFQDAMQVYTALPKMVGEDGEKAVPISVWLYPLTKMDSRAAQMVREISLTVLSDCQTFIEQLHEIGMRCSDLAKNPIADTFSEIKRKIQKFQCLCDQQKHTFQKKMARILPSIRDGRKEEGALADILTSISQSLFNIQSLNEFLDMKEQEMKLVKSYLAILKGIEVISSQNRLEEIVLDSQNELVVSFTFTSLHDEEPFLSDFQHCLQKPFLQGMDDPTRGRSSSETSRAWFEHEEILQRTWNAAKSISEFSSANKPNRKVRFVAASAPNEDVPGAAIYLYEDGELVSCNYELPQKPLPLVVNEIKHDSMRLMFQPTMYGKGSISSYQIEYRTSGEESWKAMSTKDNQEAVILEDLCPNTEYQFRYAGRCKPGLSETSETSKPVKTLPTSPPGKPTEVTIGSSTVSISWGSPDVIGEGVLIKEYNVEYREESGQEDNERKGQWNERRTGRRAEFCQIGGLRPQTLYRLRVTAVCSDGTQSAPSEETEVSTSLEEEEGETRLTLKYLQKSTMVVEGQPSVYVLPLEMTSTSHMTYHLGEENLWVPNKVMMMMGETGSGKTTLINGMVNYILGVQWEDPFRFKLIHEEANRSQAESQASDMKVYVLNHQMGFQIPYSLTIIDTPGFGDTGGTEHSISLTREIRRFLSALQDTDHLDAICIVLQASLACLTPAQRYVFDSVLSLLGKDMKDNIQVLVTFADGQTPPVLEAIKTADVPCAKDVSGTPVHFKFNNSALFASNLVQSGGSFNLDEMFWKMGCMSMKTFFDFTNTLDPKSLTLTKEVLQERKELEAAVENLQPKIKAGLVIREELWNTQEVLNQRKDKMAANRHFEYEVEKTVPVKEDISGSDNYAINCRNCHFTCHYPCKTTSEEEKRSCAAFSPNTGRCNVCPGQCVWSVHSTQRHRFQYKVVKERKIYEELKQKYKQASEEERATERELRRLIREYEGVREGLEGLLQKASRSLRRLQEIALRPNLLSSPESIDLLIMAEHKEMKPGHQERIQSLQRVRNVVELIQKIAHKEPLLPGEGGLYAKMEPKGPPLPKPGFMKGMATITSWFK